MTAEQDKPQDKESRITLAGLLVLVMLWGASIYWGVQRKQKARADFVQAVKTAPVIDVRDIDKWCGTGKPILLHLVADDGDAFGDTHQWPTPRPREKMAFREFKELMSRTTLNGTRTFWKHLAQEPKRVSLHSQDGTKKIEIEAKDINLLSLPNVFQRPDLTKYDVQIPKEWMSASYHSADADTCFQILAIPCSSRVSVFGVVSKIGDKYQISSVRSAGGREKVKIQLEPGQKYADPLEGLQ